MFIKPVILRDDKFEDLKYLSGKRVCDCGIARRFSAERADPDAVGSQIA